MTQEEEITEEYVPGTIVFAKLKGYPWWPARIESDQEMPEKVLKQKARNKSDLYNVLFYGTKDYGFFGPDAIRPFDPVNVQDDLDANKFKTRDLELAIRQALNPSYLDELKSVNEDIRAEKGKVVLKEEKVLQRGRKRKVPENVNEVAKKRLPVVIDENNHDKHKKSPEYRKIYYLRHKLQRLVYKKKKGDIPIDDYAKILDVIKELENMNMTYVYLKTSKICRVLKAARFYPFETDVDIKDRCQKLMRSWRKTFIELQSK